MIHSFEWAFKDAPLTLTPALSWSLAYLLMAGLLLAARWVTVPDEEDGSTGETPN